MTVTKRVQVKATGDECRILASEFDPALHLALGPPELTPDEPDAPARKGKKRRKVSA